MAEAAMTYPEPELVDQTGDPTPAAYQAAMAQCSQRETSKAVKALTAGYKKMRQAAAGLVDGDPVREAFSQMGAALRDTKRAAKSAAVAVSLVAASFLLSNAEAHGAERADPDDKWNLIQDVDEMEGTTAAVLMSPVIGDVSLIMRCRKGDDKPQMALTAPNGSDIERRSGDIRVKIDNMSEAYWQSYRNAGNRDASAPPVLMLGGDRNGYETHETMALMQREGGIMVRFQMENGDKHTVHFQLDQQARDGIGSVLDVCDDRVRTHASALADPAYAWPGAGPSDPIAASPHPPPRGKGNAGHRVSRAANVAGDIAGAGVGAAGLYAIADALGGNEKVKTGAAVLGGILGKLGVDKAQERHQEKKKDKGYDR